MKDILTLCLVTHHQHPSLNEYLHFLEQAIQGGVTCIQYRDKSNQLPVIRQTSIILKRFLESFKVPLILNDHVELAVEIGADGVHVGQSDMTPEMARQLLGPDKLLGYSIESLTQLESANQLDCLDYIAASAVFPSNSPYAQSHINRSYFLTPA